MPKALFMTLFLFAGVAFASSHAMADSAVVTAVKGSVQTKKAGELVALKIGDKIAEAQSVQTGAASTAVLVYPDGSRIKLKENSEVVVHLVDTPQEKVGANLIIGALFAAVTKKKEPHFFVKTPTAVAGVRGTDFFTSFDNKENTPNLWLCVHEGSVEVVPLDSRPAIVVKEGLGIVVRADQKIDEPKPYEWTKQLNWNMDPAAGDVEDNSQFDSQKYKDLLKYKYD